MGRGTFTFVFTDIERSTELLRALGDEYMLVRGTHYRVLREVWARHGGTEEGTAGDSFFVVFENASDAIAAMLEGQHVLADQDWGPERLRVRMGAHTGEAVVDDHGDYVGLAVNQAARVSAAAHGGQILVSEATRTVAAAPVGASYRSLGSHKLKGLASPVELFQVCAPALEAEFPPPATMEAAGSNLPPHLSAFIGREDDLLTLTSIAAVHRLVTLVGPGGTGKTRLAIEFAARSAGGFDAGAWFVDLAPISDPAFVGSALTDVLHLRASPGVEPADVVAEWVAGRRVLFIVDNSEHLAEGVRSTVTRLLLRCPGARVIATSRTPLDCDGERVVDVSPLPADDAVNLLYDRAIAVGGAEGLDDETAREICSRVDGLPLAIEIAAAQTRVLNPHELLNRLRVDLAIDLVGTARDSRQRTIADVIDWSYARLSVEQQRLLRRLSVFAGRFSTDAAAAVAGGDGLTPEDVRRLLPTLVHASLAQRADSSTDAQSRFRLLDTVRRFTDERLVESGESEATRRRHRDEVARRAGIDLDQPFSADASAWFTQEELQRAHSLAARSRVVRVGWLLLLVLAIPVIFAITRGQPTWVKVATILAAASLTTIVAGFASRVAEGGLAPRSLNAAAFTAGQRLARLAGGVLVVAGLTLGQNHFPAQAVLAAFSILLIGAIVPVNTTVAGPPASTYPGADAVRRLAAARGVAIDNVSGAQRMVGAQHGAHVWAWRKGMDMSVDDELVVDSPAWRWHVHHAIAHVALGHVDRRLQMHRLEQVAAAAAAGGAVVLADSERPINFGAVGIVALYAILVLVALPRIRRRHEREADLEALEWTREPDALLTELRDDGARSLATLVPTAFEKLSGGFPPAPERMAMVSAWEKAARDM